MNFLSYLVNYVNQFVDEFYKNKKKDTNKIHC